MEAPPSKWTADDISVEDLTKLPKGARQTFLLNYSQKELTRLSELETTPQPIREVLSEPGFWVKKLETDGFLIPDDILVFAEHWHKKTETSAEFLMSLYGGINWDIFSITTEMIKNTDLEFLEKFVEYDEIAVKAKELVDLSKTRRTALKRLDDTLTMLSLSADFYKQRNTNQEHYRRVYIVNIDKSPFEEGSWEEFIKFSSNLTISVGILRDFINDPFDILGSTVDQYKEKRRAQKKELKKKLRKTIVPVQHDDDGEHVDRAELIEDEIKKQLPKLPELTIQMPIAAAVKEKYLNYLRILGKVLREGDILMDRVNRTRYYVYFEQEKAFIKGYSHALPEEALPFLIEKKISSSTQLQKLCYVDKIELDGHLVSLGKDPTQVLRYQNHTFFVKTGAKKSAKKAVETRCRWLTRDANNKQRRCAQPKSGSFFCKAHSKSPKAELEIQEDRCREEDEDIIQSVTEFALADFPPIEDRKSRSRPPDRYCDHSRSPSPCRHRESEDED